MAAPAPSPRQDGPLRPTSLAEAREAMTGGGVLSFRGGGTKAGWGSAGLPADTEITTAGMDRVLEHHAADATVRVQAGMPLARLQDELADAGQWVALDTVGGDGATVGGIFATDDAGPQRLAYGTLRDLVIGVTVVLPDGAVGRSGGFVIKNVAGYDLGRLFCGSFGTLGLVAEVNLRLHPRPPATTTVHAPADAVAAVRAAAALTAAAVEPTAVDLHEGDLRVRLAGRPSVVASEAARAVEVLRGAGLEAATVDDDLALWEAGTAWAHGAPGETVLRIGTLPTDLPVVAAAVASAAGEAGVPARLASHVAVGAHTVRLGDGGAPPAADRGDGGSAGPQVHARVVAALRRRLAALAPVPGHVVVRRHDRRLEEHVDVWGPLPAAAPMRRLKAGFDPDGRCQPGRFAGGI